MGLAEMTVIWLLLLGIFLSITFPVWMHCLGYIGYIIPVCRLGLHPWKYYQEEPVRMAFIPDGTYPQRRMCPICDKTQKITYIMDQEGEMYGGEWKDMEIKVVNI